MEWRFQGYPGRCPAGMITRSPDLHSDFNNVLHVLTATSCSSAAAALLATLYDPPWPPGLFLMVDLAGISRYRRTNPSDYDERLWSTGRSPSPWYPSPDHARDHGEVVAHIYRRRSFPLVSRRPPSTKHQSWPKQVGSHSRATE
jgi:hypothetical protein